MTFIQVKALINQWIITNGNREITAAVMNPVLQEMIDWANSVIGDLSTLNTTFKNNLVGAINEVNTNLANINITGSQVYSGLANPNTTPPADYKAGDFYLQVDSLNDPIALFIYDGFIWQNVTASFSFDITGLIVEGTNITITGTGTLIDPYVINSSGSGGSQNLQEVLDNGGEAYPYGHVESLDGLSYLDISMADGGATKTLEISNGSGESSKSEESYLGQTLTTISIINDSESKIQNKGGYFNVLQKNTTNNKTTSLKIANAQADCTVVQPAPSIDGTYFDAISVSLNGGAKAHTDSEGNIDLIVSGINQNLQETLVIGNESATEDAIFRLDADKFLKINRADQKIEFFDDTIKTGSPCAVFDKSGINLVNDSGQIAYLLNGEFGMTDGITTATLGSGGVSFGAGDNTANIGANDTNEGNVTVQSATQSTTLYPTKITINGVDHLLPTGASSQIATLLDLSTGLAFKEDTANKGVADGYTPLNSSAKIDTVYFPDSILGQLVHGGMVDISTAIATLTNNGKSKLGTSSSTITLTNNTTAITGYVANEGLYYIASVGGAFAGITFDVGDWLISIGSAWKKVDNTDAISSFNSRTGAITLIDADIATVVHGASAKTTLVDGDEIGGANSATSYSLIRFTCLNLYNYLKTKFDTVYQPALTFASDVRSTVLTGFSASAGTVSATDSISTAFNKIVGNQALKVDKARTLFIGKTDVTGVTTETNLFTFKVDANLYSTADAFEIRMMLNKSVSSATIAYKTYIGTSSGARTTQVGIYNMVAANIRAEYERPYSINGTDLESSVAFNSSALTGLAAVSSASSAASVTTTSDWWITVTVNPSVITETAGVLFACLRPLNK